MGYDKMYLAVLVLSKEFYWFEIKRDEDEIKALIEMEVDWWNRYILGNEIPEIDGSDSTLNTVRYINKDISTDIKDISKLDEVLNEYEAISKQKKYIESKEKELKNNIIAFMGSNEIGNSSKYSVFYKTQKRTSIDTVTLKKDLPDIKNNIIAFMGSNEIGNSSKYSVFYKTQKRTSIDTVTLKKDLPDIYNRFSKTNERRVLRIKAI